MSPTRFMMVNPMWFTNSKNSVNRCKFMPWVSVSKILAFYLFSLCSRCPLWLKNLCKSMLILSKNSLYSLSSPVNPVKERKSIILKLFMQNEPNFPNAQIFITPVLIRNYPQNDVSAHPKNKPNSNPIKANSPNAQNDHNPIYNKRLHKKGRFRPKKTNPISNPITRKKQWFLPEEAAFGFIHFDLIFLCIKFNFLSLAAIIEKRL